MEITKLNAQLREKVGSGLNAFRKEGLVPAVVYGHGFKSQNIAVEYTPFEKVYQKAGESSLVDLKIGEAEPIKVLIQDTQKDVRSDRFIHIDFRQIKMTEKLETDIVLEFIGESRAVKEMGGILIKNLDAIAVKCLPTALVSQIEVDLSILEEFGDVIRVSDIKLPEGMESIEELETVVATVAEPRSEEELAETEKPTEEDVEGVEVEGKKKEEAPTEGDEEKFADAKAQNEQKREEEKTKK
ncbi:MAG: 50S ribosomal protein L25 [Patescibacteria group bacterium]|nr:50S ribosomal protein L25 [Patescibacteria group bacterium]